MSNYIEESKKPYYPSDGVYTNDSLQVGCLQRIAAATEAMAKNHIALINERDCLDRWYRNEQAENKRLARSNAALRGQITRLKRQMLPTIG